MPSASTSDSKPSYLVANLEQVRARIATICNEFGRDPHTVQLIAVSKTHHADAIEELIKTSGQKDFGENYAQEMLAKSASLSQEKALRWHYIGRLQSNKIQRIVAAAHCIHTVSSRKHADDIARHAAALGKAPYPIFIQVNADEETSKGGVSFDEALDLRDHINTHHKAELLLMGVMAIPSADYSDESCVDLPPVYNKLRNLADQCGGHLSLGMSDDLSLAIRAGATHVRIGTAIFGERKK